MQDTIDRAAVCDASPDRANAPSSRHGAIGFLLLLGLIALVAGAKAVLFDTMDPDCFWHLKVAEQLWQEGIHPLVDRLSFASIQERWTPYSWLAELGMKAVWDIGGYRLAVAVQAMMQAAFVLAAALACRAARASAPAAQRFDLIDRAMPARGNDRDCPARLAVVLATAFVAFLSLSYLSFRPVTAALVLLALCVWLLVRDRAAGERSRAVWCIVPLTALTVNLHLYAIFVPVWVAALLGGALWERSRLKLPAERTEADRRGSRYFILLLATGAACCATPMLPGMIGVALHYQSSDPMVASGYLAEMRPFYHGTFGIAAATVVGMAMLCLLLRRNWVRPGEFLWLMVSLLILSRWGRFTPVFAIAVAPLLTIALPRFSDRLLGRPLVLGAAAVVLALGLFRVARDFPSRSEPLSAWLNRHGPDAPGYPCAAVDWVEQNVRPETHHLITEFAWGGYLEWRLGDRQRVLLDGRTQLFTPDFWRATYLAAPAQRRQFLAQVRADAAIVPQTQSVFRHALIELGWRSVYTDPDKRAEVLLPPDDITSTTDDVSWEKLVTALTPMTAQ